jgi:hypothetical protein
MMPTVCRAVIDQETLGRGASPPVERRESITLLQFGADLGGGDHGRGLPLVPGVERHLLDEPQFVVALDAPGQQVGHVGLVDSAHRDGVDLDRRQPGIVRGPEPRFDVGQPVPSCQGEELLSVDRVEGDIDPVEPGLLQRGGQPVETDPIGRHGDRRARVECG